MSASEESTRARSGLFDVDERLKPLSDLNGRSRPLATAKNVATLVTEQRGRAPIRTAGVAESRRSSPSRLRDPGHPSNEQSVWRATETPN